MPTVVQSNVKWQLWPQAGQLQLEHFLRYSVIVLHVNVPLPRRPGHRQITISKATKTTNIYTNTYLGGHGAGFLFSSAKFFILGGEPPL